MRFKKKKELSCVCAKSLHSYPTLCNPINYGLQGSSVHGDSPGKNTEVGYHALLQEIFPNQCSNPDLSHCRQILYCLSHQGNQSTGGGSLPLLQGIFPIHESIQGLLHCRQILYQLSYQGSPKDRLIFTYVLGIHDIPNFFLIFSVSLAIWFI